GHANTASHPLTGHAAGVDRGGCRSRHRRPRQLVLRPGAAPSSLSRQFGAGTPVGLIYNTVLRVEGGLAMTFEEMLDQARAMLQRRGRVTYQTLKLQFQLDEEHLDALKDAILYTSPQVHNDAGRGLVWTHTPPAIAAEAAGRFDAVLAAVTALLRCEG